MTAAQKINRTSVEDYLAGELVSPIKHEYVHGVAYAMAGPINRHNHIAGNTLGGVGVRLRGKRWRAWNSDTKIRIRLAEEERFYYPDVSVVGSPNSVYDSFQDNPNVIFEVVSENTRRIDENEKKDAYLTIASLAAYVLVEQETASVVVWRRKRKGFIYEPYDGIDQVIPLPEVEIDLPLAEIYEGVRFIPEPDE